MLKLILIFLSGYPVLQSAAFLALYLCVALSLPGKLTKKKRSD